MSKPSGGSATPSRFAPHAPNAYTTARSPSSKPPHGWASRATRSTTGSGSDKSRHAATLPDAGASPGPPRLRPSTARRSPTRPISNHQPHSSSQEVQYETTVPSWSDKLVGEVVRLLLEAYYETTFSDRSHGFRPGRGCHTALREVAITWTGTTWFIEGDIADCFGSLDHDLMIETLSEKIHDNRFLRLVRNMLTP